MHAIRHTPGFTLIELLVVVTVLTVIIAVLLPALHEARDESRRVQCMAQQRAIGAAMQRWSRGNGGRFPVARYLAPPVSYSGKAPSLSMLLRPYLSGPSSVFQCPGDELHLYPICGISYFYNVTLSGKPIEQLGVTYAFDRSPAQVPLLWDSDEMTLATSLGRVWIPAFHQDRCALFADGHAALVTDHRTPTLTGW